MCFIVIEIINSSRLYDTHKVGYMFEYIKVIITNWNWWIAEIVEKIGNNFDELF